MDPWLESRVKGLPDCRQSQIQTMSASRRRLLGKASVLESSRKRSLGKNSILEASRRRSLGKNSVLEASRRRSLGKNSVLEGLGEGVAGGQPPPTGTAAGGGEPPETEFSIGFGVFWGFWSPGTVSKLRFPSQPNFPEPKSSLHAGGPGPQRICFWNHTIALTSKANTQVVCGGWRPNKHTL